MSENINYPYYEISTKNKVELPYVLEGWQNSVDLSKEDQKTLYSVLIDWNKKILKVHHNFDTESYLKIFLSKMSEVNKALYLTEREIEEEKYLFLIQMTKN